MFRKAAVEAVGGYRDRELFRRALARENRAACRFLDGDPRKIGGPVDGSVRPDRVSDPVLPWREPIRRERPGLGLVEGRHLWFVA